MTSAVLGKLRALVTGTQVEECELCAESIGAEHHHLLEPDARRVLCACESCASLFLRQEHRPRAQYLRVERRAARLSEVEIDDEIWADLGVPVGLGFFTTRNPGAEVVATFPGRSGIIEAFVPLKAWSELERRFPVLRRMLPDVEALLVRRSARHRDYFLVSIDHGYELCGLLRGSDAPLSSPELAAVQRFFERLDGQTGRRSHSRRPG
jgi:hypothetical protein